MVTKFKNLSELYDYFKDERVCIEYLERQRWGGSPVCPHCGCEFYYKTKTRSRNPVLQGTYDYRCKACDKKYSARMGTIFENSKLPLRTFYAAIYLCTSHKKGISSHQLARDLGITQKSAWFVLHRIRAAYKEKAPQLLKGVVEVDEAYVGGKNKNRHFRKKKLNTAGCSDKIPIMGFIERPGRARSFVLPDTTVETFWALLSANVDKEALLISDSHINYKRYHLVHPNHELVKAQRNFYACDPFVNTNSIEGYWSIVKRSILGIYHVVSAKHLQRYCYEFDYRYNHRFLKDPDKFMLVIKQCNDVRLTYKQLIA